MRGRICLPGAFDRRRNRRQEFTPSAHGARMEALELRTLLSGSTVDDFQLAAGKNASSFAIAEDSSGNLFVAGTAKDAAGSSHAFVREGARQADGSLDWGGSPVIDFSLAPDHLAGDSSSFKDLAIDPAGGDLYAAGESKDAAGVSHWVVVKRSAADGAVAVIDDYRYAGGADADARGIARDDVGNLFVVGSAYDTTVSKRTTSHVAHWIVRELPAGSSAWEPVQDFLYKPGTSVSVSDVVTAPSGVYVVGFGSGHWLAQRGVADAAGHLSWATVDDFRADPNFSSTALGAGVDAAGNVYVLGTAGTTTGTIKGQPTGISRWTVRRTTDAGAAWSSIDSFQLSSNNSLAHSAAAFGTDSAGNLYAAGYAPGADGHQHQVVRTASASGAAWSTLDDWQLASGHNTFGAGFLADHTGTLYTVGNAADSADARHAFVRRIEPTLAAAAAAITAQPISPAASSPFDAAATGRHDPDVLAT